MGYTKHSWVLNTLILLCLIILCSNGLPLDAKEDKSTSENSYSNWLLRDTELLARYDNDSILLIDYINDDDDHDDDDDEGSGSEITIVPEERTVTPVGEHTTAKPSEPATIDRTDEHTTIDSTDEPTTIDSTDEPTTIDSTDKPTTIDSTDEPTLSTVTAPPGFVLISQKTYDTLLANSEGCATVPPLPCPSPPPLSCPPPPSPSTCPPPPTHSCPPRPTRPPCPPPTICPPKTPDSCTCPPQDSDDDEGRCDLIKKKFLECERQKGEEENESSVQGYIQQFIADDNLPNDDTSVLTEFQKKVGLSVTGDFDSETQYFIKLPRCGNKDTLNAQRRSRGKRFALHKGGKWEKSTLSYYVKVIRSTAGFEQRQLKLRAEVERALAMWSAVTHLTFTKSDSESKADIFFLLGAPNNHTSRTGKICLFKEYHAPLDWTVFAHSKFHEDEDKGEIHVNGELGEEREWTVGPDFVKNVGDKQRVDLFKQLLHEIGHVLGLDHFRKTPSTANPVMRFAFEPHETSYDPAFALTCDDISGIQALYGRKGAKCVEPCTVKKINTIFKSSSNILFVFQGEHYWPMNVNSTKRLIRDSWFGLPSDIDAAYTHLANNKTYFFKGPLYWRYSDFTMDKNYPRLIAQGFKGVPPDIDVAFMFEETAEFKAYIVYYFKGGKYYKYDTRQLSVVESKDVTDLRADLPNDLEGAFTWVDKKAYVYKCGKYFDILNTHTPVCTLKRPCSEYYNCAPGGNDLCSKTDVETAINSITK